MRRKPLLRGAEVVLLLVVVFVLPASVSSAGLYLVAGSVCVLVGAVLAYLDGRNGRH